MGQLAEWKGTSQQFDRLKSAIERNCPTIEDCLAGKALCTAHSMLVDQVLLNRLAFTDRTFTMYRDEEFGK